LWKVELQKRVQRAKDQLSQYCASENLDATVKKIKINIALQNLKDWILRLYDVPW